MDTNIVVAIVSASSAVIVAIAALTVNAVWMGRAFAQIDKRMDDFGKRMDRLDGRLDHIESTLAGYVLDVATIKGKLGM